MSRKYIKIIFLAFLFGFCAEEEKPLVLFNPEAFAYDMDEGYELIATARIKGFTQVEVEDKYHLKLEYTIHIVTPSSDTLKNLDRDIIEEYNDEESEDRGIEVQIYLSGDFKPGNYTIIFDVKDLYSNRATFVTKDFVVTAE